VCFYGMTERKVCFYDTVAEILSHGEPLRA